MNGIGPRSLIASFNGLPIWRRPVRVWDFVVTPPTLDRLAYLSLHRFGCMGRAEREFFDRTIRPGMHVVDAGANIGLYSLLFCRLVGPGGRVYSFEPDEMLASALRANLAANRLRHARVFVCAVGSSAGVRILRRNAVNSGDNRMRVSQTPCRTDEAPVPVCTLADALLRTRVDFIKLDVQGWEAEALRGMSALLDANPSLRIHFEFWPRGLQEAGTSVADFADILRGLGLQVWQPRARERWVPVNIENLSRTMGRYAYTNLVAARLAAD